MNDQDQQTNSFHAHYHDDAPYFHGSDDIDGRGSDFDERAPREGDRCWMVE